MNTEAAHELADALASIGAKDGDRVVSPAATVVHVGKPAHYGAVDAQAYVVVHHSGIEVCRCNVLRVAQAIASLLDEIPYRP